MNKTAIILGMSLVFALMISPMAMAASTVKSQATCSGAVAVNCYMSYTWCSPNDGGPTGYRSTTGSCNAGYQPQFVTGTFCILYSGLTEPPLCVTG